MSVLFSDGGRTVVASGAALTIFEDDRTIYIYVYLIYCEFLFAIAGIHC